jgi:hypothetical protein
MHISAMVGPIKQIKLRNYLPVSGVQVSCNKSQEDTCNEER